MAKLILNEWVWVELAGNDSRRAQETFEFLNKVYWGDDIIVIVRPSPSMKKVWSLCSKNQMPQRGYAKYITNNFLKNADKCSFLENDNLPPLDASLSAVIKQDDHYLVRALKVIDDAILITTDGPLKIALDKFNLACRYRDDYLFGYK